MGGMMKVGYARVSTLEQNAELQQDALNEAECEKIYTDHVSEVKADRPGLQMAETLIHSGGVIAIAW